jgi:hypothetical protein
MSDPIVEREYRDTQFTACFLRRKSIAAKQIEHDDRSIIEKLLMTGVAHDRRDIFDHHEPVIVPKCRAYARSVNLRAPAIAAERDGLLLCLNLELNAPQFHLLCPLIWIVDTIAAGR